MKHGRIINPAYRYHAAARRAAARLITGDASPETLHRLRTNLRRLEAYFDLIGDHERADALGLLVSHLSKLRTLQVFALYLEKIGAPGRDLREVRQRIEKARARIEEKQWYRHIEQCLMTWPIAHGPVPPEWIASRLTDLRHNHMATLQAVIASAVPRARRTLLHQLRLRLKAIRYQEEWAGGQSYADADIIPIVKRMQAILGRYEERAQFRKLAQRLDLVSETVVAQAWRRARERARAVPEQLPTTHRAAHITFSVRHAGSRRSSPTRPRAALSCINQASLIYYRRADYQRSSRPTGCALVPCALGRDTLADSRSVD